VVVLLGALAKGFGVVYDDSKNNPYEEAEMLLQRAIKLHSLAEKTKAATGFRTRDAVAPVVIGVAGGSYCGKRSFCRGLKALLESDGVAFLRESAYRNSPIVELDSNGFPVDFLVPGSELFDSERLLSHLEDLIAGNPVFVPGMETSNGVPSSNWQLITPSPVVVVEGEFVFENPSILNRMDFKVFIDVPVHTRVERLVARERERQGLPEGWDEDRVLERLRPIHGQYVESFRSLADAVVSGENPFEPWLMDLGARVVDELQARRRR
jgi:uridine kinase